MTEGFSKYKRAILFSGGGTRFGIYCGMYAFLEDNGLKPDLIIASCGGSMAATIISRFHDNIERKAYLQSEELYHYVSSPQLTAQKKLYRLGGYCLRKLCEHRKAPIIEDVFNRYLVELPQTLDEVFPSLAVTSDQHVPTVIIGSEILFSPGDAGKKRKDRKLYRKVIFTDRNTAGLISRTDINISTNDYRHSAVDEQIEIRTGVPLLTASRISVSDMFYVPPVHIDGKYYAGGAIDLVPVELAEALADEVIVEKKQRYTSIEEALVRSVLGYSGNKRLEDIKQATRHQGIDTTDAAKILRTYSVSKHIDWKRMEIILNCPRDYNRFVHDMEMQWQYGYRKAKEFIIQKTKP